jgi:hypothetical protein
MEETLKKIKLFKRRFHRGFHRAVDMLFSLQIMLPFLAGVVVTLNATSVVTTIKHVQCGSELGWETYLVEKGDDTFCFYRQSEYPHRIKGGRY